MRHAHRLSLWLALPLVAMSVLAALAALPAAGAPAAPATLQSAWSRAARAGSYRFATELVQTTRPAPALTSVGRGSTEDRLRISGSVDARAGLLELQLLREGAGALDLRVADGRAYGRVAGGEWQELEGGAALFPPGAEALAYLAAARNVRALGQEGGATRLAFDLDGAAFAASVRDQLASRLGAGAEAPAGLTLEQSRSYEQIAGDGVVWLDPDGLPARMEVTARFPEQPGGEQVEARLSTTFSQFDRARLAAPWYDPARLAAAAGIPDAPLARRALAAQGASLMLAALLLGGVVGMLRSRRARAPLAALLIVAMVATPAGPARAAEAAAGRQEEAEQRQAEDQAVRELQAEIGGAGWDSSRSPLAAAERAPAQVAPAAPTAQGAAAPDPESDADRDGLTYVQEVRLGTSPTNADSDGDMLTDDAEVNGFLYRRSDPWYSDPLSADTNGDGRLDTVECPQRRLLQGDRSPRAACQDSDADGTPDLFDDDDDGDGVADRVDMSPQTRVGTAAAPFTGTRPLTYTVDLGQGSAAGAPAQGYPVLVDFQLRPTRAQRLTYAYNVYDWPSGDSQGQIARLRSTTFATELSAEQRRADPRAANGDTRVTPMLEISMSGLPLPLPTAAPRAAERLDGAVAGAVTLTQGTSGADLRLDAAAGSYAVAVHGGICGALREPLPGASFAGVPAGQSRTLAGGSVLALADGDHAVVVSAAAGQSCATLGDIPSGGYVDRMIDAEQLRAYGISVRDGAQPGSLLAYLPLEQVRDITGMPVAFTARMYYRPPAGASWGRAHEARVVWLVQQIADTCTAAAPAGQSEAAWCARPENRADAVQIVHVYDDDWTLTGMDVREDRGMRLALVYEDPAPETAAARGYDDRLWQLASGLEQTFVAARCTPAAGDRCAPGDPRDITVDEIARRWDGQGVASDEQRWNIPRGSLRVRTLAYDTQDAIAQVMMTDTVRLLREAFDPYRDLGADAPTLLFAREETARAVSLDERDLARPTGAGVVLDLSPAASVPQTVATLSWAPYRYRSGRWESLPLAEYLDRLGARVQAASTLACGEDCRIGEAAVAKGYYQALYAGAAGTVQVGSLPTPSVSQPRRSDNDLAKDSGNLIGVTQGQAIASVVGKISESGLRAVQQLLSEADEANTLRRLFNDDLVTVGARERFLTFIGQGVRGVKNDWADSLATNKLTVGGKIARGAIIAGVLAGVGVSIWAATRKTNGAGVANQAANAVNLVVQTQAVVSSVKSVRAAVTTAGSLTKAVNSSVNAVSKATASAAVIGAIVSVAATWGSFGAQMGIGGLKAGSIEANKLAVKAVAQTIVAAILLAIGFIPVVGQLIVAIVGLIDAIVLIICGAIPPTNTESDRTARDWLCDGLSGVVAQALAWFIYGAESMVDLEDQGRVQSGGFDVQPVDPRLGLTAGSAIRYGITVTSTIQLAKVPADWKAQAYRAQFSLENLRSATLRYRLQVSEADFDGEIGLGDMDGEWQVAPGQAPDDRRVRTRLMVVVRPTLDSAFDSAGINRQAQLVLTEAQAIPYQECFIIGLPIPVCRIRAEKLSTHTDFGKDVVVDVLPRTLDEFAALTPKGGGFAQAWDQEGALTFPRLADADGDELAATVAGGNDPNDSTWDADGDGVSDAVELQIGSDPGLADRDADGLTDAEELRLGTAPGRPDSDGDGLADGAELAGWSLAYAFAGGGPLLTRVTSDPLDPDADSDGLLDSREKVLGLHPRVPSSSQVLSYEAEVREAAAPRAVLRFEEPDGAVTFGGLAACAPPSCPAPESAGRFGRARRFGAARMLSMPLPTAALDTLTVHAWVRADGAGDGLIAYSGNPSSTGYGIGVDGGRLAILVGGVAWLRSSRAPAAGAWQQVAATRSGGLWRLYVDGAEVLTQTGFAPGAPTGSDRAAVGGLAAALDDVAFFDRALSAAELATLRTGAISADDLVLRPGELLRYRGTVRNELFGRFADGLFTTAFPGAVESDIAPRNFVLQPTEQIDLAGEIRVRPDAPSGPLALSQVAGAIISDRREAAGNASLWLRLDDPAGTTRFADDSGVLPPRPLTCATPACPAAGQAGFVGGAASFDGVDDALAGSFSAATITNTFTIAAWVLPGATHEIDAEGGTGTAGATGQRFLVGPANGESAWGAGQAGVGVSVGTNGVSVYERGGGAFAPVLVWPGAVTGWTHIAVVYDNRAPRLYVNGVLARSVAAGPRAGLHPTAANVGGFAGGFYRGGADDLRLFGRALTPQEVTAIYGRPALRLAFDGETSGARTFRDTSGTGASGACQRCPRVAAGAVGLATEYTGGEYLSVGPSAALDMSGGAFTQALWVNPSQIGANTDLYGILGLNPGGSASPPAVLMRGRRIEVGFGTASGWATRTTFPEVLQANTWSHVVAAYDGSGYRVYVNGAPVPLAAGSTVTGAPPAANRALVGRASTAFSVTLNRLFIRDEGDGAGNAEVYILWNGQRVFFQDDLDAGDQPTLNLALAGDGTGRLQVYEEDGGVRGDDDLLLDRTFSADSPALACGTRYEFTDSGSGATTGWIDLCTGNFSLPFRGRLDDVTLYRRALSEDEVRALYDSSVTALHLRLDDPPASTLFRDAAGRRAASCAGAACPVTGLGGRSGQAARFDGVDDALDAGPALELAGRSFTVGLWARRSGGGQGIALGQGQNSPGAGLRVGFAPDGSFVCGFTGDDLAAPAPADGAWHHWACAYDSASRARTIFRDGQQVAAGTAAAQYAGSGPLLVGRAPWGAAFAGLLDDVRVLSVPLGQPGVEALFRSAPSLSMHFDDLPEAAGFAEDGGRGVACATASCPARGAKGQVGLAGAFRGTPQVGTGTPLQVAAGGIPAGDFTVSFWTQLDSTETNVVFLQQGGFPIGSFFGQLYAGAIAQTGARFPGGRSWTHVAVTRGAAGLTLYLNGYAAWRDGGLIAVNPGGGPLTIGANSGGGENLSGQLDELAIYPRALTPAELRDIFTYQNGWVDERKDYRVTVDRDPPATSLRSAAPFRANRDAVLDVAAADPTTRAALVELGVARAGGPETWLPAPPCADAVEGAAFCPTFDPQAFGGEGRYTLRTRGVDLAGNAEAAGPGTAVTVDATPPTLALGLANGASVAPSRHPNDPAAWVVRLSGSASDPGVGGGPGSGVRADSLRVTLRTPQGELAGLGAQPATLSGGAWSAEYVFGAAEPSGLYQVVVSGEDTVGNAAASAPVTIALDATPTTATLDTTQITTGTLTLADTLRGAASDVPALPGAVLRLRLDEPAGASSFADASGSGNAAACAPACPAADPAGRFGGARRFGSGSGLTIPDAAGVAGAALTVAAWVRPDAGAQPGTLLARGAGQSELQVGAGSVRFIPAGQAGSLLEAPAALGAGWSHVAGVFDGAIARIYVNGALVAERRAIVPAPAPGTALMVGRRADGTAAYAGLLDELTLFGRALPPDAVRALAAPQVAGVGRAEIAFRPQPLGSPFFNEVSPAGQVLHLPFDDLAAPDGQQVFRDLSESGTPGRCLPGACPRLVAGHVGQAAAFGIFEQVLVDQPGAAPLGDFTVSQWFRLDPATLGATLLSAADRSWQVEISNPDGDQSDALSLLFGPNPGSPGVVVAAPAGGWQTGRWYHYAFARTMGQGGGDMAVAAYLDGAPVATSAILPPGFSPTIARDALQVGLALSGAIDDTRMFGRPLRADEVERIYLGSGPQLALGFDDRSFALNGASFADRSGWERDATLREANVALGRAAAQSSSPGAPDRVAGRAVDGVTGGAFDDGFTFTADEPQPWWQVDLGAARPVGQILIWGRTDCCAGTIRNLRVFLSEQPFAPTDTPAALAQRPGVWSAVVAALATPTTTLDVSDAAGRPVRGRYLRVQREDTGALIIAEVQVFDRAGKVAPGQVGAFALDLDGVDDTAQAPGGPGLDLADGTIAAWVRPDWAAGAPAEAPAVLSASDGASTRYSLHVAAGLAGLVLRSGAGELTFPATFTRGAWRHVAVTVSGGQARAYVDGQPAGAPQSLSLAGPAGLPVHIGSLGGARAFFRGGLDDVQVFRRALQPIEVQALAAAAWRPATLAGAGAADASWTLGVPAGLEGFYKLDLRGVDAAGFQDALGGSRDVWSGPVDTLAPRVSLTRRPIGDPLSPDRYRVTVLAQDFNLSETGFESPCPAAGLRRTYYGTPQLLALSGQAERRLYQISGTCDLPGGAPAGVVRARDAAGNQAEAAGQTAAGAPDQPAILDLPQSGDVFTSLAPVTVRVAALSGVTVGALLVNGAAVPATWSQGGSGAYATWTASWTPAGEGRYTIQAEYTPAGSSAAELTEPAAVYVDTAAPLVAVGTAALSLADLGEGGRVAIAGTVAEAAGLERLEVTVERGAERTVIPAAVDGGTWTAPWYPDLAAAPDGETVQVTARAVDVAGRAAEDTRAVPVDLAAPAPFALDVTSGGQPVAPGDTLRGASPALDIAWGASGDGGGLARLEAGWYDDDGFGPTFQAALDTAQVEAGSIARPAGEDAVRVTPEVRVTDAAGNRQVQTFGPIYLDGPLTPDFVRLDDGPVYRGWMEGPCALIGTDRRVQRGAGDQGALRNPQQLYASWNTDVNVGDLRLAWTGANWNTDGDLFIYFDTVAGGAIEAYNPYGAGAPVYMPGVTPANLGAGAPGAFGADFLVWVKDGTAAELRAWSGGAWQDPFALDPASFRFDPSQRGGQTDLALVSESIGVNLPQSTPIALVAFATEEGALRPWAALPADNPVSSTLVAPAAGAPAPFALSRAYRWPGLPDGACANGSLTAGGPDYPDADLSVTLEATPGGAVYRYLADGLAGRWQQLFASPADPGRAASFGFLDARNRPLPEGGQVTYTLRYRNDGAQAIAGLRLELSAWNGLSLAGGNSQTILLGDLAPGESGERTVAGQASPAGATNPAWANLAVQVLDATRAPGDPPLELLWADHQVDVTRPSFAGAGAPDFLVSPGLNRLAGFAFDESGVATMRLRARPVGGGDTTFTCPDDTPDDGMWSCVWSATQANGGAPPADGARFELRLVPVDGAGREGDPTPPRLVEVQASVPPFSIDLPPEQPLGQKALGQKDLSLTALPGATIGGTIEDVRAAGIEVCVGGSCAPATISAPALAPLSYLDEPAVEVSLAAAQCGAGLLTRTFSVTDTVTVSEVRLALAARGDVRAVLRAPGGASVTLIDGAGVPGYDLLLSDDAPLGAEAGGDPDAPYEDGAAHPAQLLGALAGSAAAGDWALELCDADPAPGGALVRARLEILPLDTAPRRGTWSYTLPVPEDGLDGGTLQVAVRGVVRGGPVVTRTVTLQTDTTAPELAVEQLLRDVSLAQGPLAVLRGQARDGGGLDSVLVDVVTPAGEVLRERVAVSGGAWSFVLAPGAEGLYRLSVSAVDAAGNVAVSDSYEVLAFGAGRVMMPMALLNARPEAALPPRIQLPWVQGAK